MAPLPNFDRASLKFHARRLERGIEVQAQFTAPQLSTGRPARYQVIFVVSPKTGAVMAGSHFMYSRDGSKYLAFHGGGKDQLRQLANQIGDRFLASAAWATLRNREPDRNYVINHLGKVTVRAQ